VTQQIEEKIAAHLIAQAMAAYPHLTADNVIVRASTGEFEYTRNKGRSVIGSERLTVECLVDASEPIDRRAFVRQVGRREIDFGDGYRAFQEYKRHINYNYVEVAELKRVAFYIQYTYDIEEA
jgi:hypothetical protein